METRSDHRPEHARPGRAGTVELRLVLGSGSLIHQVGRELSTAVERRLAKFDVSAQQAALLINVGRRNAAPGQIAARLGTDSAGVTRLLDRLEAKGLLRRDRHPQDRRSVIIELTDQGRALVPRLALIFGQATRQLLDGFTDDEVRNLSTMLQRMLNNLRG